MLDPKKTISIMNVDVGVCEREKCNDFCFGLEMIGHIIFGESCPHGSSPSMSVQSRQRARYHRVAWSCRRHREERQLSRLIERSKPDSRAHGRCAIR